MGEAADRKVTEIEETRRRIEADLNELEDRMPPALRSLRAVVGAVVGTAAGAFVLRKLLAKRSERKAKAEVVVRVVREDRRRERRPSDEELTWRDRRASRRTSKA